MRFNDRDSAGLQRALIRAREAADLSGQTLSSAHVLAALVAEESRASEILHSAGVSLETKQLAMDGTIAEISAAALLRSARGLTPHGDETGTLHLLAALLEADGALAERLGECGLDRRRLDHAIEPRQGGDAGPLRLDEPLFPVETNCSSDAATERILDAAANRAREGLRVLEDLARFALNDSQLTEQLKSARHQLSHAVDAVGGAGWLRFRDTPGDVGTTIHTTTEAERPDAASIVTANCKRVQEALRTLEEFGKRVDAGFARSMGELRYAAYSWEQRLMHVERSLQRLTNQHLCLLVTEAQCRLGVEAVVAAALAGGCRMFQMREKNLSDRQLLGRARRLRLLTRDAGALLIINDRPDIAVAVEADGVHLGQDDMPVREARRIIGSDQLIGVSTHDPAQIEQAVRDGADYLGVGPVFESVTKSFDSLAGLEFVRQAAAISPLPWFAIGGIQDGNCEQVVAGGGRRVAVGSAVAASSDPELVTRTLIAQLTPAGSTPVPA
jgi:thiamine-phosphate pyrophosphorylase